MENKKNKGFTLVELIVVIAIIAVLAILAVVAFTGFQDAAQAAAQQADAQRVVNHLNLVSSLQSPAISDSVRTDIATNGTHTIPAADAGGGTITVTVGGDATHLAAVMALVPPTHTNGVWSVVTGP